MKEILYALALVVLIGWVTVCNGDDQLGEASCRCPNAQPTHRIAPVRHYGFHRHHYSIQSAVPGLHYHTQYAFADYPIAVWANVPNAERPRGYRWNVQPR